MACNPSVSGGDPGETPSSRVGYEDLDLVSSQPEPAVFPLSNSDPTDADFLETFHQVELASEQGMKPQLSAQGSSGAYFVKDITGVSELLRRRPNDN